MTTLPGLVARGLILVAVSVAVAACSTLAEKPLGSKERPIKMATVPFLETVVTFTLTPTDAGTRLSMVQSGFKEEQKRELGGARYGWKMMGGKLVELLARTP
jgi:uncharacterized protein YndB with AHSA1/START domain